jgi:hypothetical protein
MMGFDYSEWRVRYDAFCERAAKVYPQYKGKSIDPDDANHPWLQLMREEAALQAELPPAKVPTPLENAISELTVTTLFHRLSAEDQKEMRYWQSENYNGTPTFESPQLQEAAAKVIKWRDRAMPSPVEAVAPRSAEHPSDNNVHPTGMKLSFEALALATLASRPDLTTVTAIAEHVGCTREHLSRNCPNFKKAFDVMKCTRPPARLVRGTKSKEDGTIEAWLDREVDDE